LAAVKMRRTALTQQLPRAQRNMYADNVFK
jgi:hypothetical protein